MQGIGKAQYYKEKYENKNEIRQERSTMRNGIKNMSGILHDPHFLATLVAADNALQMCHRSLNSTILRLEPIVSSTRLDESMNLNNRTFMQSTQPATSAMNITTTIPSLPSPLNNSFFSTNNSSHVITKRSFFPQPKHN